MLSILTTHVYVKQIIPLSVFSESYRDSKKEVSRYNNLNKSHGAMNVLPCASQADVANQGRNVNVKQHIHL